MSRILGLHGKGTSGEIFRTQASALCRAAGIDHLTVFESGPNESPPFHHIERYFPNQTYRSWYDSPTPDALADAHDHLRALLEGSRRVRFATSSSSSSSSSGAQQLQLTLGPFGSTKGPPFGIKRPQTPMLDADSGEMEVLDMDYDVYTPASAPSDPSTLVSRPSSRSSEKALSTSNDTRNWGSTVTAATEVSSLSKISVGCFRAYDGMICFSQGCALAAGLLLQQAMDGTDEEPPVKFAIFICGSRPFSPSTSHRYSAQELSLGPSRQPIRIEIPTLHLIGKDDQARGEGHLLAALCSPSNREVIEFNGGHSPPRKSRDVQIAASAIKRLLARAA